MISGASAISDDLTFAGVQPVEGFSPFAATDAANSCPEQVITPRWFVFREDDTPPRHPAALGEHNAGYPHRWAVNGSRIRRLGAAPYLQFQLGFPAEYGEVLVFDGSRLVDRAELVRGWQHSAVELKGVDASAELTLEFRDGAGEPVDRVGIRSIFLSDSWGRGQRRRLKCAMPFDRSNILQNGDVSMCMCPEWLTAGNVLGNNRGDGIKDIWNDAPYQRVRSLFLQGRHEEVCRKEVCLVLSGDIQAYEPAPEVIASVNEGKTVLDHGMTYLQHDIDRGCNLDCIMCRDEKILPDPKVVNLGMRDVQDGLSMGSIKQVTWSGAGEVFAMKPIVKLMETDAFTSRDVDLGFTTNLTYFNEKLWAKISHNTIAFLAISADGCSREIYNKVRLGGDWTVIERNMRLASRLRHDGQIGRLVWNYTVLRQNVPDVAKAVALAEELGFDNLRFIAQFGELSRTEGNMFEECDQVALDALYDQLDEAKAFDKPWVWMSETGMRDRRYRSAGFRLDFAQHVEERPGYASADPVHLALYNRRRSTRIVQALKADMDAGRTPRPTELSENNVDFLERFAASLADPGRTLRALREAPRRAVWDDAVRAHSLARWARKLATSAAPASRRRSVWRGRIGPLGKAS